jgi:hypothetical protein
MTIRSTLLTAGALMLRVPDERRVFARLVWLFHRWRLRWRQRRRARALADERTEAKLVGEIFAGDKR